MNFLFLSSAYGKGGAATNHIWTELCEHLAQSHSVDVFTASRHGQSPPWSESNGVQIHRLGSKILPKIRNRHAWEVALLFIIFISIIKNRKHYDYIICVDTPRFLSLAACIQKWRDRSKVIMYSMDLPLEQVIKKSKKMFSLSVFAAVLLNRIYYLSLSLCDRVVVLGCCMREVLKKNGVQNLSVIGPWADKPIFDKILSSIDARRENGFPEKFTIAYRGYAGEWHEFDAILDAIRRMGSTNLVQFVFAGFGPGIDQVAAEKEKNGWENVLIKEWVPRGELGSLPQCADIHLVSLKHSMLGTCVPSKTYGAFANGRPVIFLGPKESQVAKDITELNAGRVVQNADELISAVKDFQANPDLLKVCATSARNAFLEKHCAQASLKKWDELLTTFALKDCRFFP